MNFTGAFAEGDREFALALVLRDGVLRGTVNGEAIPATAVAGRGGAVVLVRGGERLRAVVARDGDRVLVHLRGRVHELAAADGGRRGRAGEARRHHAGDEPFAASPMTGVVAEVPVASGDAVPKGGTLAVVEAMKMQFVVRAPRAVVVRAVKVAAGQSVAIGEVLLEFEEGA